VVIRSTSTFMTSGPGGGVALLFGLFEFSFWDVGPGAPFTLNVLSGLCEVTDFSE
jgi:hypothetical protein